MSNPAITWAKKQKTGRAPDKCILVLMADAADKDTGECYPSQAALIEESELDRKTLIAAIGRLRVAGFIVDTGKRKGATNQVIVWRLATDRTVPETEPLPATTIPKTAPLQSDETVPYFPPNSPVFPGNGPVFPTEQSRISHITVPNTGHGTLTEPKEEPKEEPSGNQRARVPPPPLELVAPDRPVKPRQVTPIPKPVKGDDAELMAFWEAYPRKRDGIGKARQEWAAARKKASFEEIMAGLGRYEFDDRDRGKWLPMAATWLNQERWTTQPDTKPIRAGPAPRRNTDLARKLLDDDDEPPPIDTSDFDIELSPGDYHET